MDFGPSPKEYGANIPEWMKETHQSYLFPTRRHNRSSAPVGVSGDSDGTDIRSFYDSSGATRVLIPCMRLLLNRTGFGGHRKRSLGTSSNLPSRSLRKAIVGESSSTRCAIFSLPYSPAAWVQQVLEATYYIAIIFAIKRAGPKLYQEKGDVYMLIREDIQPHAS